MNKSQNLLKLLEAELPVDKGVKVEISSLKDRKNFMDVMDDTPEVNSILVGKTIIVLGSDFPKALLSRIIKNFEGAKAEVVYDFPFHNQ